jgi:hypothetical protein
VTLSDGHVWGGWGVASVALHSPRARPWQREATRPGRREPGVSLRRACYGTSVPWCAKIANSELLTAENPTV